MSLCVFPGDDDQEPVDIEGTHIIFQFKGLGNALILLSRESSDGPLLEVFLVCIFINTSQLSSGYLLDVARCYLWSFPLYLNIK